MKAKLVLSVLVLGLAACSFGGVVIGNFEGGSLDGWIAEQGGVLSASTVGATAGSGSLKFDFPSGWGTRAYIDAMPYLSQLTAAGSKITLDVSARSNDIPGYWSNLDIVIDCDGYWGQQGGQNIEIGWTEWFTTKNYEYALSDAARTALSTATYANIKFLMNTGAGTLYIDNVQIVPEPTTMALLGLGGLLSLRRKH